MQLSLPKLKRLSFSKLLLLLLLTALVGLGALPGYVSGGEWRWTAPPRVVVLKELKQLRQNGLTLTGWQTVDRQNPIIGEHKWLQQTLTDNTHTNATLFLFPQNGPLDQPAVEWTDLDGAQGWKTDSKRNVDFIASAPSNPVTAQFFRAWTEKQTYAVLQWYAWAEGGHPQPSHWFVVDRLAQWQNRRVPWVAVSVLLPIEPLDDIEKSWSKLESLAQAIQTNLRNGVFKGNTV